MKNQKGIDAYKEVQNNGKTTPSVPLKNSVESKVESKLDSKDSKLDSKNIESKSVNSKDSKIESKIIATPKPIIESKDSKYQIFAAQTQGRSHIQSGAPCQDRAYGYADSNIAIITLCDGAGSAKYSHFGAECVTKNVADLLKQNFDKYYAKENPQDISKEIIESNLKNLESLATTKSAELKTKANINIKKILKDIESKIKNDKIELKFNCENEINLEIKNKQDEIKKLKSDIESKKDSIKNLEAQKAENAKRNDYIQRFEINKRHSLMEYSDKLIIIRVGYKKILDKQNKSTIEKFIDFFSRNNDKDLQNTIDSIENEMQSETNKLDNFTANLESHIKNAKNADSTKLNEILNNLEIIGNEILNKLENVYMNLKERFKRLKKDLKADKDLRELEYSKAFTHVLSTRKRFTSLITDFINTYKDCIIRQKNLIESNITKTNNDIKDLESKIKNIESKIKDLESNLQKNRELKASLESKLNEFNTAKSSITAACENLSKNTDFSLQDIESLKAKKLKDSKFELEKIRNECLNFANNFKSDTKGLNNTSALEIESSLDSIKKEIENSKCEVNDLKCTLLFAAIKGNHCLVGHLGDGTIGAIYESEIKVVSSGDNGEHANETYFINTKGAQNLMRFIKADIVEKKIKGFVLMSDGSSEGLLIKKENKFAPALSSRLQDATLDSKSIESLIEKVKEQKSFDDCSIAILREKI